MVPIQLLRPEPDSVTEELQVYQWPEPSDPRLGSSEQAESGNGACQWDALKVSSSDRSIPRPVCFAW